MKKETEYEVNPLKKEEEEKLVKLGFSFNKDEGQYNYYAKDLHNSKIVMNYWDKKIKVYTSGYKMADEALKKLIELFKEMDIK